MNALHELTVLNILSDPLIAAFADLDEGAGRTNFLHLLYERGAEQNFAAYVASAVLTDENAFSRACAAGHPLPGRRRACRACRRRAIAGRSACACDCKRLSYRSALSKLVV